MLFLEYLRNRSFVLRTDEKKTNPASVFFAFPSAHFLFAFQETGEITSNSRALKEGTGFIMT